MKNINEVKAGLIEFLEGEVSIFGSASYTRVEHENGDIEHYYNFDGVDVERDNAPTKLECVNYGENNNYGVSMKINGHMQDIGAFEIE